ncbi:MAG: prevent-host-death protein [Lachnospiraceae bacterium]|uniref:Prevent-host-death protein n=1 Tax=Candidatus Weimeria bifida TaxID=2599074 RepID=A0A6N7IZ89_9FIRM|nr:prevent-host-death protein [Candidatus Weimeria bifida]RRF95579.1 MAG: prevent-host-death protein [Lachnospiraceae bacterium]
MPNIKPISDLRNYTSVVKEVSYGNRVYLTKNGHGQIAMINMQELDDIEKQLALYKFEIEMQKGEKSIKEEETVSSEELRKELGI